jgi:hypothetical protein
MGVRSYVPQLGRFLQTDPRPGGSANAYSYVFGDPINTTDLTGEYTWGFGGSLTESLNAHGNELAQAYEAELRAEAERKAREAAQEAAMLASFETEGPEEEWEEEGGEYEGVAWHHPAGEEHEAGSTEEGLLFQSLQEGASEDQAIREKANLAALCRDELRSHAGSSQHGACARYVSFWSEVEKGYNWAKSHIKRLIRSAVHFVKTQYVSWKELVGRLETAFHVGKEVFGYGKCIYELATVKGACGNP